MIKESFYRFFKRKRFLLSLFIIGLINVVDILPRVSGDIFKDKLILQSAFLENILINGSMNMGLTIFVFLAFILATLPMADCLVEDRESGIDKIYMLKLSKREYVMKKFFLNFLYAGFNVSLVIIVNLLIWLMLRPTFVITYYNVGLINEVFLVDFLTTNPTFFFVAYIFLIFFVGGVIGSVGMFLNDIFDSRYIAFGGVFILDLIISLLVSLFGNMIAIFDGFIGLNGLLNGVYLNFKFLNIGYVLILFLISLFYFLISKKKGKGYARFE